MRIVFRTEGNHRQGMGDLWASIALADECGRSDEIWFLIGGGEAAVSMLKERGYRLYVVGSLAEEQAVLRTIRPDVILVNKLQNPSGYIKCLKELAGLVVTVDDDGPGAACADLNVNVLYHIPEAVIDPQYLALRREFRTFHARTKTVNVQAEQVLITQGGSDTYGFTPKIVRALETMTWRPRCTVVVGPAFRHEVELDEAIQASSLRLSVVKNAKNMAELLWGADLVITAGGLTMFESACVGTPSLVVCGESFEVETAARLEQAGAVVNLGFGGTLDYACVGAAMERLASNVERRRYMSLRGKALIDGSGGYRVITLIRARLSALDKVRT